jgi:hypothetical protein
MAKLTNAQLIADNNALRDQLNTLRTVNANLCADYDELKAQIETITSVASALNTMKAARPAYVMPAWQVEAGERMAAAKALAMASGHTTRA